MSDISSVMISIIVILVLVIAIASRFNISARFERAPKQITPWNALDQGIDPTDQKPLT